MLWSLITHKCLSGSIVLHVTHIIPSITISGIPNNAGHLLVPQRIYIAHFLYIIVTLHTTSCIIFNLLCEDNMTLLSVCFVICSNVALRNNILNISSGITLPSLLMST